MKSESIINEFEKTIRALGGDGAVGLEQVFEYVDERLNEHMRDARVPEAIAYSRALERIHYEIKRVIQQECNVRESVRAARLEELLRELPRGTAIPIISFNYDNLVELAVARARMQISEVVLKEPVEACDLELVKVHGSVTWMLDRNNDLTRYSTFLSVLRRLGALRSPILERPLIYPSRNKLPIYGPFLQNAERVQSILSDPKYTACVAVGYSFSDEHVRAWIADALQRRSDLALYVVDDKPHGALDNLTRNLPGVAWTERLHIVQRRFHEAIESGFDECLRSAERFGSGLRYRSRYPTYDGPRRRCFNEPVSGIGATRNGESLYISHQTSVLKIDLDSGSQTVVAADLKDPRGICVAADGTVLVIQNRLSRCSLIPTTGAGNVLAIEPDGRRKMLVKPRLSDIKSAFAACRNGIPFSEVQNEIKSILHWPTDVAWRHDGAIFATESRALCQIDRERASPSRFPSLDLMFNLHGLDVASDGNLVGVEEGVAQDGSWSRVFRCEMSEGAVRYFLSAEADGLSRLMGICFVSSRSQVVVTQGLTWPHGGLLVLDYPSMNAARFLAGFDFPQKIEYVPGREMLAIGTRSGVDLIPLASLDNARPLLPKTAHR